MIVYIQNYCRLSIFTLIQAQFPKFVQGFEGVSYLHVDPLFHVWHVGHITHNGEAAHTEIEDLDAEKRHQVTSMTLETQTPILLNAINILQIYTFFVICETNELQRLSIGLLTHRENFIIVQITLKVAC